MNQVWSYAGMDVAPILAVTAYVSIRRTTRRTAAHAAMPVIQARFVRKTTAFPPRSNVQPTRIGATANASTCPQILSTAATTRPNAPLVKRASAEAATAVAAPKITR